MAVTTITVGDGHTSPDYTDMRDFALNGFQGADFDSSGRDVEVIVSGLADHAAVADLYAATNIDSLTIKAKTGEECLGEAGGSSVNAVIETTNAAGYLWFSNVCEMTIQDIEIDGGGFSATGGPLRDNSVAAGGGSFIAERCYFHNTSNARFDDNGITHQEDSVTWVVRNCIFENLGGSGFGSSNSTGLTIHVEGCAFYNCNKRGDGDSGGLDFYAHTAGTLTATVSNCLALGNGREDFVDASLYDTFNNSMSSDTSAGSSNGNHSNEAATGAGKIWTDAAAGDFTLVASTNADGGGATIAAIDPDVAGNAHNSPQDIGPFAIPAVDTGNTYTIRTRKRTMIT